MSMHIPANSEVYGLRCGGCNHPISRHEVTTELGASKLSGKCKICKCKGVSFS